VDSRAACPAKARQVAAKIIHPQQEHSAMNIPTAMSIPTVEQLNAIRRKWLMQRYAQMVQEISAIQVITILLASEECAKPQPNQKTLTSLAEIEETLRKAQARVVQHVFKVGCKM
jgi:hypothetical protein